MFNKKVLIEALKKVDAAKAPAKKKDIEVSLEGQWKGKGEYRIPSNQITMEGVNFPVVAKPNVGPPVVMQPGEDYQFSEDVTYVDETPLDMAKRGGIKSKKYSKSLLATNRLYKKNPLYKKKNYKSKTYDPMAMYFQTGGPYNYNEFVSAEKPMNSYPPVNPIITGNEPGDYQQFLDYSNTAPENRRPYEDYFYGNSNDYDHYGMWDALGKPKDFEEALKMNPWWEPDPYDKMYHGFSVNPNTGVFLKAGKPGESKPGDTTWMEIAGHYLSPRAQVDTPVFDTDLQRFKYIPNKEYGGGTTKPGCKPVPPTAAEVQAQILNEGKGPTAEGAARVSRAAKLRADWEKRCGSNTVTEVKPEVKSEEKPKRKLGQLGPQSFKNGGDISIPELNQYEEGGFVEMELTREEIKKYIEDGHRVEDVSVPSVGNYKKGGALLTKKVTCKKCGWEWDAADGGDDVTTCHKCGGQGLVHAQTGLIKTAEGIGKGLKATSEFRNMMNALNEAGDVLPTAIPASVNIAKGLENVKPKLPAFNMQSPMSFSPTRVAASRPILPEGFSPIRFGDDYTFKGKEWYNVDPADYPGLDWKKEGLKDASDSLNSFLSKLPPYGPDTFKGMGDFRFKDFSEGSNFRRDMLAAAAGPQRQLSTEDFFTDDELIRMAHQQADYWNARDQFDIDNPEDPIGSIFSGLTGRGTDRDELFSLLYPNASMPNWREKFMYPHHEKITQEAIGDIAPGLDRKGELSEGALDRATGRYPSFEDTFPIEAERLKKYEDSTDYLYTADPKMLLMEMSGGLRLKMDDINNASPEQLEKWRQQLIEKDKARDLERYKALLGNPFTAGDAYSKMTLNKYGGVPKAQAGLIKGAEKAYKAVSPFLRGASIATLGTLNSVAKNIPIMIHPFGFAENVGPFTGSPLNFVPGYGKEMKFENNTAFRKFGDTLDYVKLSSQLNPAHGPLLRYSRIKTPEEGNWAEYGEPNEGYKGVFGAKFDFNNPDTNLGFKKLSNRKGVLITDAQGNRMPAVSIQDPGLSFHRRLPFSNRYSPVDLDNPWDWKNYGGNLQALLERYGYAAAYGAGLGAMGYTGYQENLDKYVNEPVSRFVENSKKQMEEFLKGSPVKKK
jgi:hypothetical protein